MSEAFAKIGGVYVLGAAFLLAAALIFAPRDLRRGGSSHP
jgi:hypothetical protein